MSRREPRDALFALLGEALSVYLAWQLGGDGAAAVPRRLRALASDADGLADRLAELPVPAAGLVEGDKPGDDLDGTAPLSAVARALGVSTTTVKRHVDIGKLRAIRDHRGHHRVLLDALPADVRRRITS